VKGLMVYDKINQIKEMHNWVYFSFDDNIYTTVLECASQDPNLMCETCDCWKMTRKLCS
jgi:hypothetical protein